MSSGVYYDQPQAYNWLDAMSKNKAYFDPRTIDAYSVPVTSNPLKSPFRSGGLNPQALAALPSTSHKAFISKWAEETSTSEVEASQYTDSDKESDQSGSDVASESSSTTGTSIDKDFLESFQIEVEPPYPKPRLASGTLYDLHNQIRRPDDVNDLYNQVHHTNTSNEVSGHTAITTTSSKSTCPTFAQDDYIYSPFENIEMPSMALSSAQTTDSFQSSNFEEMNLGKLIAGKARQVVARSAAVYKSLKRKAKS